MPNEINVGGIYADLDVNSDNMERGLANARRALDAVDRELKQLDADLNASAITLTEYTARTLELTRTQTDLASRMQAAYAALGVSANSLDILNAGMGQATTSSGNLARGLMQLGYAVDDVQYGFNGIVNNISPLVYSFTAAAGASSTMAMGIASAAQIVVVAAYQVYEHWSDFMDLLGVGIPTPAKEGLEAIKDELKEISKEIDNLHSKPRISVVEEAALDRLEKYKEFLQQLEKDTKHFDSLKGQTKEEKARGRAADDAINEQGRDEILKSLENAFGDYAAKNAKPIGKDEAIKQIKDVTGLDLNKDKITPNDIVSINKAFGTNFDSVKMRQLQDTEFNPAPHFVGAGILGGGMVGTPLGPVGMGVGAILGGLGTYGGLKVGRAAARPGWLDEPYSLNSQLAEALGKTPQFLNEKGKFQTPQSAARDLMDRATKGDQDAAIRIKNILGPDSAFAQNYDQSSPEAKAADKAVKAREVAAGKAEVAANKARVAAEKAERERDKALDAAQDAFDFDNKQWQDYAKRRDAWAAEQAAVLEKGDLGTKALKSPLSEKEVYDRMTHMGLDRDQVNATYADVTRRLNLRAKRSVQERMGETGLDQATAAAQLERERQRQRTNELNREANEILPGVDTQARDALLIGTAMTGNGNAVATAIQKQIAKALEAQGVSASEAKSEAEAVIESAKKKANEDVMEEAANPSSRHRTAEVFDAASLATRLQSSVGEDYQKKQTDLLEQSTRYLAQIAQQKGMTLRFGAPGAGVR